MPTLNHYRHGERFDILGSDVAAWLVDQAAVRQWIFNICKWHGAIVYDEGRWRGAATPSMADEQSSRVA
jgi:hypothetical protein